MGLDDNVKTDVAADAANDTDEYQKSLELQKQISLRHSMQYELPKKHQKAKEEGDNDDEEEDEFDLDKYPVREWKIQLPWLNEPIAFNPLVSGVGVTILWGLAIWCMGKLYGQDLIYCSHTKSKFQISL